ncbi:DUF928 domain-containing protein [Leptothoe spongobia]|uniref:DUF928 domain-containing protein n=1 Tax=Leptothoe spongobia TAU-MAC 1115 TaxID=1967444 RepID=A0A947GIJ7_9CYAN|nr:DUF928 domain-containing protein [Leptothoe spongobia]MBT9314907.1 DUF928 domain-containing protein [Leptothoe spongobia TAU-MAC 1115]
MAFWGTTAVLSILLTAAITQPGKAQRSPKRVNPIDKIVFHETFDPPGDDSPNRTSGVGSRDSGRCNIEEQPVQALMPENNFGLTFAERPTVVVQLPENTSTQRLILTVMDEAGLYYAEEEFSVVDQTGLITLSLSSQAPPLAIGRNYRWHVVVVCGEQADPDNPVLVGWVQRVDAALSQSLQQQSPLGQAQWLAENGYWYDMLQVLMGEINLYPHNQHLQEVWRSVLPHKNLK